MKTRLKLLSAFALFLSLAVIATSQDAPRKKTAARPASAPAAPLAKRPFSPLTGGDTCASPPTNIASLPFNDSGNTTGAADDVSAILAACGSGYAQTAGPDLIYQFTVGAGNNLTITVTPTTAWDPKIYILATCGTGGSCITGADVGGDGTAETINPSGLAPGTYFLYVDSFFAAPAANSAGPYTLSVTGSLGSVVATATPTNTPIFTNTPTNTPTITNTPIFTNTPTNTPTITNTPIFTNTPTNTPTSTPTVTQTVAAATATPTSTSTPTTVPASSTPTPTVTSGGGGPGNGPSSPVPTLSGWMLALFAVGLAAAALFMTRRL
jgi:cell division septation protein DedD